MLAHAERTLRARLARAGGVIRRVIGAPDYERYLAHLREAHPGVAPLTREQFAHDALARRYDRPGSRCC
jgi:uncharacterized short protein YbdD (DUF466 family)